MTSSVASRRWRYESRISCCLASSRESTVTCDGVPSSPVSSRRTTACPSDPVPPVTRMFFPASGPVIPFSPYRCAAIGPPSYLHPILTCPRHVFRQARLKRDGGRVPERGLRRADVGQAVADVPG